MLNDDPEGGAPRALPLVLRVEKRDPPSHEALCEAAATAVVLLLASGEFEEAVRLWEDGRIRKVTRRARGARWRDAERPPGVTVAHAGAEVRAYPPCPIEDLPPELAKMQVAGTDLEPGPTKEPGAPYCALVLNADAKMTTGKAAAQAGHAAHLLYRGLPAESRDAWLAAGAPAHIVDVPWAEAVARAAVTIRDAGFTEVAPGTLTAVAWLID
ncbi:peptidyl-tRNA hydrolase [Actinocorallia longicatena]|uniref:peptidyl-tRNA hydrolase n=1 Tax=Actinocorallia longicatena TaxID=111803 RepID=A0ABP6PYD2_9ACTN